MTDYEERARAVAELCAKTSEMHEHASTDDDLALYIRAHLHYEGAITRRLQELLTNGAFDWDGETSPEFLTRARLAYGLNVLDQNSYLFAKRSARTRNQFAHQLDRVLSEEDFKDLYNVVGPGKEVVSLSEGVGTAEWLAQPQWRRGIVSMFWYQTLAVYTPRDLLDFLLKAMRQGDFQLEPSSSDPIEVTPS